MYKIPLLSPFPISDPLAKEVSAASLHIEHCAHESIMKTKTKSRIKRNCFFNVANILSN